MTKKTKEDNAELARLQNEYLTNENDKNFGALWLKALEVTKRIVNAECYKKHLHFSDDYKKEIIDDAVLRVLKRYKTYKEKGKVYKLDNFVSGLYYGVIWSMYGEWRQRQREEMSIDEIENNKFKKIM